MARTGRPTKLTPEVAQAICAAVAAGNFRQVAARAAGVSPRTLGDWLAKGKAQATGPYADFLRAVLRAEQDAEMAMVKRVVEAASQDAKHAEWFLERKFPDRWGRKDRREVTGAKGGPLQVEATRGLIEDPSLVALMKSMRGWRPEPAEESGSS